MDVGGWFVCAPATRPMSTISHGAGWWRSWPTGLSRLIAAGYVRSMHKVAATDARSLPMGGLAGGEIALDEGLLVPAGTLHAYEEGSPNTVCGRPLASLQRFDDYAFEAQPTVASARCAGTRPTRGRAGPATGPAKAGPWRRSRRRRSWAVIPSRESARCARPSPRGGANRDCPRPAGNPAQQASARVLTSALLVCGLLYGAFYVVSNDVVAVWLYDGVYSRLDQAVSELSATSASSRPFELAMLPLGTALLIAFGSGIWRSAHGRRTLRVVGGLVVAFGVTGIMWIPFPMSSRQEMTAGTTPANDVGHLTLAALTVLLIVGMVGVGAAALGKWFRIYSILTLTIVLLWWTHRPAVCRHHRGRSRPGAGAGGTHQHGAWLVWLAVLAITLLREQRRAERAPRVPLLK